MGGAGTGGTRCCCCCCWRAKQGLAARFAKRPRALPGEKLRSSAGYREEKCSGCDLAPQRRALTARAAPDAPIGPPQASEKPRSSTAKGASPQLGGRGGNSGAALGPKYKAGAGGGGSLRHGLPRRASLPPSLPARLHPRAPGGCLLKNALFECNRPPWGSNVCMSRVVVGSRGKA